MNREIGILATIAISLLVSGMIVYAVVSCSPCKPGTARCNGSVVEICRPDKRWAQVGDCSKVLRTTKKFKCCCRIDSGKEKCGCKIQVKK